MNEPPTPRTTLAPLRINTSYTGQIDVVERDTPLGRRFSLRARSASGGFTEVALMRGLGEARETANLLRTAILSLRDAGEAIAADRERP